MMDVSKENQRARLDLEAIGILIETVGANNYIDLLALFDNEIDRLGERMIQAVGSEDHLTLGRLANLMKSSCGNLGLSGACNMAERIEVNASRKKRIPISPEDFLWMIRNEMKSARLCGQNKF